MKRRLPILQHVTSRPIARTAPRPSCGFAGIGSSVLQRYAVDGWRASIGNVTAPERTRRGMPRKSHVSLRADARWSGVDIERVVLGPGDRRVRLHSQYAVVLTNSGSGVFRCDGQVRQCPPRPRWAFAPACLWIAEASPACGWSYTTLWISPRTLRGLAAQVSMGEHIPQRGAAWAIGDAALDAACRVVEAFDADRRLVQGVGALIDLVAALSESTLVAMEHPTPPAVARARTYLDHHSGRIESRQLARHVAVSPFHLIRIFHQAVGVPPRTYATLVRLAGAEQLLRAGVSIADAADRSGFYDQSHMNRYFRRVLGVTPGEYRKSVCVRQRPTITLDTMLAYRFRGGEPLLRRLANLRRSPSARGRRTHARDRA